MASLLNHKIKLLRDSPSPCRIFRRLKKSFFGGIHVMNLELKAIATWVKLLIEPGLRYWYHFWVNPINVNGKTRHKKKSLTSYNCIVVLKMSKWLFGFEVPSYLSKLGNLKFDGNVSLRISSNKGKASPKLVFLLLLLKSLDNTY